MANVSYSGSGLSVHTATKNVDPFHAGAKKAVALDFSSAADINALAAVGTSSFTVNTNAGAGEATITAGGSKAKLIHPNISGTSAANRMTVSARIKSADPAETGHGMFVGFAEDVATIANTMTAAGALRAADNAKDMVGFYKDIAGNLDYYASSGSTEGVNEVDSTFDMAADTYVDLAVELIGNEARFYRNGDLVKTYTAMHDQAATLFPVIICSEDEVVTISAFTAGM
tara:strand:+ start:13 stop:699 length:687 start_codon:yes stop_codon:yes gene_type:complete